MNKVANLILNEIADNIEPVQYKGFSTYGVLYVNKEADQIYIQLSKYHDEDSYINLTYFNTIPNFSTINSMIPTEEVYNLYIDITNILLPTFKKDFGFGDVSSVRIAEVRKDKVELYINLKD
jgi:hypothetical protein